MPATWSSAQLDRIADAEELEIAVRRAEGTLRRWTPIWVVTFENQVYVRTWYRRDTGWFGHAVDTRRARVRVPGMEADVEVEDVGNGPDELRAGVDAAYRAKYARYGSGAVEPMVTGSDTTLRLTPGPRETH